MSPVRTFSAAALLLACACAGSRAAPPPPQASDPVRNPRYTADERKWMTLCTGLADTAWTSARAKKQGIPRAKMLARFETASDASESSRKVDALYRNTVREAYEADFEYPWDYAVSFFKECSAEVAHVSADRVRLAAYCVQNSMFASAAYDSKRAGLSRAKAYEPFAVFKSETPAKIFDRVYASSSKDRGETVLGEWNSCIDVLSE